MQSARRDLGGAELLYKAALRVDPLHSPALNNFAMLLEEKEGDTAGAGKSLNFHRSINATIYTLQSKPSATNRKSCLPYTIYHIPYTIYTIYHIPYTIYHILSNMNFKSHLKLRDAS